MTLLKNSNGTAGFTFSDLDARADEVESNVDVLREAPFNVKDAEYGATGLGLVDDSAAIQAAIDDAELVGGSVFIPPGVYLLNSGLTVAAAEVTLYGAGYGSQLKMANTASLIGIDVANAGDRCTIRDLRVTGSTAQGAGAESHAINFQENANYGKVINVRIDQPGGDGIHFAGNIAPWVERCFITDCDLNGITLGKDATTATNHALIRKNWIQSCTGNGIYAGRVEIPVLVGNRLEVNGTDSAGTGNIYLFETLYPVVADNYIENGADFDLRYNDGGGGWAVDGSIVGNLFQATSAPDAAPKQIWLEACFRCEVAHNKFSSVLSATTNIECGSSTNGLRLRKHHYPNTATGVVFASASNTSNGLVESSNATLPSVASAATVTLPGYEDVEITGTTNITGITAGHKGRRHTLRFTDASPGQVVKGGNLKIAGTFYPSQGDTITLESDGTSWNEVARSNIAGADPNRARAGQYAAPPATSNANYTTSANQGRIIRFVPDRDMTITKIAFAVVTAAGADDACDVAIYDSSLARLAAAGATSGKLNSAGAKTVDLTASLKVTRGTVYYVAFSCGTLGGTAAALQGITYAAGQSSEMFGTSNGQYEFGTMASAHPLPSTYTRSQAGSGPLLAVREA